MLNPIFSRARNIQNYQAEEAQKQDSDGMTLNTANLNNKIGSEQESQTISVNYNLLLNNDIVRWNDTEIKLRSPTGLTTINKVKFRQFVGELLPYTSLTLPSLKCDIVCYVSPKFTCSSDVKNKGYIYGKVNGNYNSLINSVVSVNSQTPFTLVSLNKPWTYNAEAENQIEYNIEEMLKYVNTSFTQWISSSQLNIEYLQDNLEITSLYNILKEVDSTAKLIRYTNESTLVMYRLSDSQYEIIIVTCSENKLNISNPYFSNKLRPIIGLFTFRTSIAESTLNDSRLIIAEDDDSLQLNYFSNNGVGSSFIEYTKDHDSWYPIFRGWSSCSPSGMIICNYENIANKYLYKIYIADESIESGNRVLYLDLSSIYESFVGYDTMMSKTIQTFVCYFYILSVARQSSTTFNVTIDLMIGKFGRDSNNETRVVYDYMRILTVLTTSVEDPKSKLSAPKLYTTSAVISTSFDDGMLLSDYYEQGFDKRDRFTSSYNRNSQYVEGSSASNITVYGMVGDKYYYKGHKTSSSTYYTMTKQPIKIHTKVLYINSEYIIQSTNKAGTKYNYTKATNFSDSLLKNYVEREFITPDETITRIDHNMSTEYELFPIQNSYLSPTNASYLLTNKNLDIDSSALQRVKTSYYVNNLNSWLRKWIDEEEANKVLLNMINLTNNKPTSSSEDIYFKYENGVMSYPFISYQSEDKSLSAVVSFVPVFYSDPYYFKTSIEVNNTLSSIYTVDIYSYSCEILTLNDDILTLLETLLLLQYEYNDLQIRCNNFPNNDNIIFSINEVCRISFKEMQVNNTNFELVLNICDSTGGAITLETLKKLYGKLQLCVDFER